MEISYGVERTGLSLAEHLTALKEAGARQHSRRRGGNPRRRGRRGDLSPNKLKVARWIEVVRTAHALGIPSTSTMMYGHTERPEHWVRHMLLLRDIQGPRQLTEFVPLGFIHSETRLFRKGHARAGASFAEDLIVHALARLLLNDHLPNIQVSSDSLASPAPWRVFRRGANDFSGTLMKASRRQPRGLRQIGLPGELRAMIRTIGRVPAERSTVYEIRQMFPEANDGERLPLERLPMASGYSPIGIGY